MSNAARFLLAFTAACVIPAAAVTVPYTFGSLSMGDEYAWVRIKNFGLLALFISGAHVFLVAAPVFAVILRFKAVRWWSALLVGLVVGAIPVAVWLWPLRYADNASASHWNGEKMVDTITNGMVTTAGWLSYAQAVAFMAAFGGIGGMSFWLVWRGLSPNPSVKGTSRKRAAPYVER